MSAPSEHPEATEPTSGSPPPGRLDRLTLALEAFLRFQDAGAGADRQAFLAQHAELADLLEPMLDDLQEEPGERREPDPASLQPGRQVGDYRIVREVGRGGMGIVFEAEQISLRRKVAVKLLHPHLALSPSSIERFRHEASVAGGLQHPAIVPIHEVGEWRGLHFFSMEFVAGHSLQQLAQQPRLGLPGELDRFQEVAELVAQVADALQHAHDRGLIHRDVKPHNIMIGHGGVVRLLDFGLVKSASPESQSVTGGFLGTPQYCSPEQASGGAVGPRSDVFSLGVVLYELLARRRPFEGETTGVILRRIEEGDCEPLRRVARSVPRDLATICHKALEVDVDHRYADAGAMAADLRRYLRIEPITARPPGAVTRCVKWIRRHRVRVALSAAAAIVAFGVPSVYAVYQRQTARVLERERVTLDRAEDLAFRSIEQTLTMLQEQLRVATGPVADGREHVDEVVRLCEGFLALRAQDPKRRLRVARALNVVCYVYLRLGQFEPARAAVRHALAIVASSSERADPAFVQRLHRRWLHVQQLIDPRDADEVFERATAAWSALAGEPQQDPAVAIEFAETLLVRVRALGDVPERRSEACRLAARVFSLLPEGHSGTSAAARSVIVRTRAVLGVIRLAAGEVDEAHQLLRTADGQLQAMAATPQIAIERLLTTIALGEAQQRLGRRGAAEASLRGAILAADELGSEPATERSVQRAVVRCHTQLASLLLARGDAEEAERLVRTATRKLPERVGPNWLDRYLRGQLDAQLACCLLMRNRADLHDEACALLTGAAATFRRLVAQEPARHDVAIDLGGALSNLAAVANERERFADARAAAREALDVQRRVLRAHPDHARARAYVGMHFGQLAFAAGHLGDVDETVAYTRAAVDHTTTSLGALRMAAEGCVTCAAGIARADSPSAGASAKGPADRSDVAIETCRQHAVTALRAIADRNKTEARRWLTAQRFRSLRDRADYRRLVEDCKP